MVYNNWIKQLINYSAKMAGLTGPYTVCHKHYDVSISCQGDGFQLVLIYTSEAHENAQLCVLE